MRELLALRLAEFDAQPFALSMTAKLDAPPYAVFAELADPSLWFPTMRRSVWKTGATSGVDAEREVDVIGFGRFRERMLAWDASERVAFTMIGSTSPLFVQLGEDFQIESDSRIRWRLVGRPTVLGRALVPALRPIVRAMFRRALDNLEKRAAAYPQQSPHRGEAS